MSSFVAKHIPVVDRTRTYRHKATEVQAVQWTGENIDAIREIYDTGTEYLIARGARPGDYVMVPRPGRLDVVGSDWFNENYEKVG
jgi:hypothetical protein